MQNNYITLAVKEPNIHLWPGKGFLKFRNKLSNPPEIISVNDSAAEILLRCDGTRTISDIASELSAYYKEDLNEVLPKVNRFVKSIENTGYLVFSSNPHKANVNITGCREYPIPMHAAIEITSRCNLKCKHCYNSSSPECNEVMSLEKAIELFSILKRWGIGTIELTGGEPLTHPNFKEVLRSAQAHFDLVAVITNGVLLDDSIVDIMKSGDANSLIQIDLDGSIPEYVNWFRGQDNVYEREIQAIKKVVAKGILLRVAMIITPGNLDQMEDTASLVNSLGVSAFAMSLVVPQGRGRTTDSNLILSSQELEKYFSTYRNLSQRYKDFIYEEAESKLRISSEGNCGAGSRSIIITPMGGVKCCRRSEV